MSLSLDATLASAQTAQCRKPIIELTSVEMTDSIPYDGQIFVHDITNCDYATPVSTSDGKILTFYYGRESDDGYHRYLRAMFTDSEQKEFEDSFIVDTKYNASVNSVDAFRMANNKFGVVAAFGDNLRTSKVDTDGTILDNTEVLPSGANYGGSATQCTDTSFVLIYPLFSDPDYDLFIRTSADFETWGSPTTLTIAGRDTTKQIRYPHVRTLNNGDLMLACGLVTEENDTTSIENIVYSISSDNGSTWSTFTDITGHTTFDKTSSWPDITIRDDDTVTLSCDLARTSIDLDPSDSAYWHGIDDAVCNFHIDTTNRKIYFVTREYGSGNKTCEGVGKADLDTMTLENSWYTTTTPALHDAVCNRTIRDRQWHGDRHLAIVGESSYGSVDIIDGEANTVTHYHFKDDATYSVTANVEKSSGDLDADETPYWGKIDYANNRAYIALIGDDTLHIGYIELDDPGVPYTFTSTLRVTPDCDWNDTYACLEYLPDDDICIYGRTHGSYGDGQLFIYSISEGAEIKHYRKDTDPSFPIYGVRSVAYDSANDVVYGSIIYDASDQYATGLLEIDLNTDVMKYYKPEFDTLSNYYLYFLRWKDSNELMVPHLHGMDIFNTTTKSWTHYGNDNQPGLIPPNTYDREMFYWTYYDSTLGMYLGSTQFGTYEEDGHLILFSPNDLITQTQYMTGTKTTGWAFDSYAPMVQGYQEEHMRSTQLAGGNLFSTWYREVSSEDTLVWDKEDAELDLAEYLVTETPIVINRTVNGKASELSFEVAHGHLFDYTNLKSLLAIYLKKGRKIDVRMGDTVSDVNYWIEQGSFKVTEVKLNYVAGEHPRMSVLAKDKKDFWENHLVEVSTFEDTDPATAAQSILTTEMDYSGGDFDMPSFECDYIDEDDNTITLTSFNMTAQWIDSYLNEIVDQIANRFGYYMRIDVDDKITAKKITNTGSVDHAYSDNNQLIEYSPDDTYSDYTNRIIVTGEETDFTEMIYGEERIDGISGTFGWWGCDKDFKIWYSSDRSRRARHPRLVVLESSTSIGFKLAGRVRESISEIDDDNQYCVIEVKAPNLIPHLLAAIAAYIAGNTIGDACPMFGGLTIPVGRILERIGIVVALMVLGSVGNFKYEIYARPLGYVRRSVSGQADDTTLQNEIGSIIVNKQEGFLCNTGRRCKDVASFELMLAKLQRKRLRIKKTAHLQDEDGDIISFPHPYTDDTITFYVTDITRTFKKAGASDDGYFIDELEGWII